MRHTYKGLVILRTGTSEYPWNIYRIDFSKVLNREIYTHVGYERTLKECRNAIDDGRCTEEI